MSYQETGESYSNDKHPDFPIGMKFELNENIYTIYRVNDITDIITCVSPKSGFQYIGLTKLKELIENGKAKKVTK
mgnify:CR=1 FL=1